MTDQLQRELKWWWFPSIWSRNVIMMMWRDKSLIWISFSSFKAQYSTLAMTVMIILSRDRIPQSISHVVTEGCWVIHSQVGGKRKKRFWRNKSSSFYSPLVWPLFDLAQLLNFAVIIVMCSRNTQSSMSFTAEKNKWEWELLRSFKSIKSSSIKARVI